MLDLWYKNAVVYCLDVETFSDSDGGGVGDFSGLENRLDYIAGLGATCIWLMPFFPSPNRDDGYDVMDYYGVDPRLGTLGDFVQFTHQAHEHGLRIIIDLVVNHTSDQHPWFQAARSNRTSKYRDYYIWSEERPEDADKGIVFPGHQESIWSYDDEAGAYYHHRFYKHQPDLNTENPAVREEIKRIMGFWLQLGVSGFRLDAAPFIIEPRPDRDDENSLSFAYLREFRDFLSWRQGDAILLAEANVAPDELPEYFGDGNRMHLLFNFYANQYLFLALAREHATPLAEALKALPELPRFGQWANFARNHDELDLGRLSDEEREEVFAAFASDPDMRIYKRGIRRRLATMLANDRRRLELVYSLIFALPGTPVLKYGEEIGMGDDLSLPERHSVRTPMQWSDKDNAGFSSAPEGDLIKPIISDDTFGYDRVNVAAQQRDNDSLLTWMERLIRTRRSCPELGWGQCTVLEVGRPGVLAHRSEWNGSAVVAVHNFAAEACSVDLPDPDGEPVTELLSDQDYGAPDEKLREVRIDNYGYRWFRIGDE